MKVFLHHIYEYQKGLRRLVLCTMAEAEKPLIERRLQENKISYLIWPLKTGSINVFFGHAYCIDVLVRFNKTSLTQLTHEEDYILGIMLGYDRLLQCKRYLERTQNRAEDEQQNATFRFDAFDDPLSFGRPSFVRRGQAQSFN